MRVDGASDKTPETTKSKEHHSVIEVNGHSRMTSSSPYQGVTENVCQVDIYLPDNFGPR